MISKTMARPGLFEGELMQAYPLLVVGQWLRWREREKVIQTLL